MKKILIFLLLPVYGFAQLPATSGYLLTKSNGAISIGTEVNTAPLTIANFTTSFVTPQAGTMIHIVSDNVVNGRISNDTYNNTSFTGPIIQGRRARGTAAVPLPPILDDIIMSMGGDGYGTSSYTGSSIGSFNIRASGTFTDASKPTYLSGTTTPSGSTTQLERFKVASTGAWKFNAYGTGAITGTPAYALQVDASGNIIEGALGGGASWGGITGTLSSQTDLQTALNAKQATITNGSITNAQLANGAVANLSGTNTGDNAANTTYASDYRAANFVAGTNYLAPSGNGSALTGLTASQVGLANVNNTSDANKPVSTAQQTALDLKANTSAMPVFLNLASNFSSTIVTEAAVTGWTFPVTVGKTYRIEVIAAYQTAATTTGGELGFFLTASGAGTIRGSAEAGIVSTAAATGLKQQISVCTTADAAGSNLISTGVTAINSPHYFNAVVTFTCTASGTFNVGWASEVAASASQLNANSTLIYQLLN